MIDWTQRNVVITGAASGIGEALAHHLAGRGARLLLADVDATRLATVAQTLRAKGASCEALVTDVASRAALQALADRAEALWGGADVLINNAGIQHVANIDDFPPEKWDAVIAINLTSAFHTTRLALKGMKQKNWGRIVNVASVHGLVASAGKAAYVAAKHGLVGLTKVTALETAQTGVTANAICPGWVLTPLVQKQVDDRAAKAGVSQELAKQQLLMEKQPSGTFVTPDQLAALAVFLCSDAASEVRGVAWNMDGGWTAQ